MFDLIFSWFSKKDNIVNLIAEKNYELEQNEQKITKILDSGNCPDCLKWKMYEGPSGVVPTNIYCDNCGSHFNYAPGFITQRIHKINLDGYKNSKELDRYIITNWFCYKVSVSNISNLDQFLHWCETSCQGNWSVNSTHFYFEQESDALAFKLRWI